MSLYNLSIVIPRHFQLSEFKTMDKQIENNITTSKGLKRRSKSLRIIITINLECLRGRYFPKRLHFCKSMPKVQDYKILC